MGERRGGKLGRKKAEDGGVQDGGSGLRRLFGVTDGLGRLGS